MGKADKTPMEVGDDLTKDKQDKQEKPKTQPKTEKAKKAKAAKTTKDDDTKTSKAEKGKTSSSPEAEDEKAKKDKTKKDNKDGGKKDKADDGTKTSKPEKGKASSSPEAEDEKAKKDKTKKDNKDDGKNDKAVDGTKTSKPEKGKSSSSPEAGDEKAKKDKTKKDKDDGKKDNAADGTKTSKPEKGKASSSPEAGDEKTKKDKNKKDSKEDGKKDKAVDGTKTSKHEKGRSSSSAEADGEKLKAKTEKTKKDSKDDGEKVDGSETSKPEKGKSSSSPEAGDEKAKNDKTKKDKDDGKKDKAADGTKTSKHEKGRPSSSTEAEDEKAKKDKTKKDSKDDGKSGPVDGDETSKPAKGKAPLSPEAEDEKAKKDKTKKDNKDDDKKDKAVDGTKTSKREKGRSSSSAEADGEKLKAQTEKTKKDSKDDGEKDKAVDGTKTSKHENGRTSSSTEAEDEKAKKEKTKKDSKDDGKKDKAVDGTKTSKHENGRTSSSTEAEDEKAKKEKTKKDKKDDSGNTPPPMDKVTSNQQALDTSDKRKESQKRKPDCEIPSTTTLTKPEGKRAKSGYVETEKRANSGPTGSSPEKKKLKFDSDEVSQPTRGTARMTQLSQSQKDALSDMASPSCMDAGERKRQYAALGRAINKSCNPQLLAKYQLCNDSERWGMLKQWILNDGKTDSITIEEKYIRWTEELRSDKYTTDNVDHRPLKCLGGLKKAINELPKLVEDIKELGVRNSDELEYLDEVKHPLATLETDIRDAKRRITLAKGSSRSRKAAKEAPNHDDEGSGNRGQFHSMLRAAVFINACAIRDAVTLRQGPILTPSNMQKLETANYLFHSALNWLASEAISQKKLLWKIRPKLHKLDHIAYDEARRISPLWVSCYADEDFVARFSVLAQTVRAASSPDYATCRWAAGRLGRSFHFGAASPGCHLSASSTVTFNGSDLPSDIGTSICLKKRPSRSKNSARMTYLRLPQAQQRGLKLFCFAWTTWKSTDVALLPDVRSSSFDAKGKKPTKASAAKAKAAPAGQPAGHVVKPKRWLFRATAPFAGGPAVPKTLRAQGRVMDNSTLGIEADICRENGSGVLLPLFREEWKWDSTLRFFLYFFGLGYMFCGVGVVSDIFMNAIEEITSKTVKKVNPASGEFVRVKVWNATVANLTLMALGSSAPEILLSIIELLGNEMYSGELGPSTIVGSAAFNLLCIIAVCISAIPPGETRKIKELPVFVVTTSFSIFAYVWLLFILLVTSPSIVEIWEGVFTFIFFWMLISIAYMAVGTPETG
eukprot:symbB.v1.2.009202.t2/scaffold580.1/size320225/4